MTFGRVYCINLNRRPDRWKRFSGNLTSINWTFPEVKRFAATDGSMMRCPDWWKAGRPAWGCRDSHVRVLKECLDDGVESVLILEDDAKLPPDFSQRVLDFLKVVPDDWELIYLGGQHQHEHKRRRTLIRPGVVRPYCVNRTHAWAFSRDGIRKTIDYLSDLTDWQNYPTDHIDHRMGRITESRGLNVYCPEAWIVSQAENKSDIDGKHHKERMWQPTRSLRVSPNIVNDGRIRVGAYYPNLNVGGAEVWLRSLLRGLDPSVFAVSGVSLTGRYSAAATTPFGSIPVGVHINDLTTHSDVIIAWGVDSLMPIKSRSDIPIITLSHGGGDWSRKMLSKLSWRTPYHAAVSEYCRDTYHPSQQGDVIVIENGIDLDRVTPRLGREEARRALGIPEGTLAIGYVGRMSSEKDPMGAARAVACLPNSIAVYCGPDVGNYRPKIESLIGRSRLIWTGYRDDVSSIYGALDCFVLTSVSEGFALAAVEAWAAGVPVVASPVGAMDAYPGVAEIVPSEADGQTIADAALRAVHHSKRNTVEMVRGFSREFFSSEEMCRRWGEYIIQVLVDSKMRVRDDRYSRIQRDANGKRVSMGSNEAKALLDDLIDLIGSPADVKRLTMSGRHGANQFNKRYEPIYEYFKELENPPQVKTEPEVESPTVVALDPIAAVKPKPLPGFPKD